VAAADLNGDGESEVVRDAQLRTSYSTADLDGDSDFDLILVR